MNLPPNNLSKSALSAMGSSALEFSDDVVESTNPLLVEIFTRIESGESTYEEEERRLFDNYRKYGTIHV